MVFNLDEIKQALKQPKSYIWDSYTSSKPSASNLVGKSDVAFGNTPQYSAASTADDFWRKSQESDSNYYESRGYTFDGTKWNKQAEEATDFTNTLGVQGWLNTHGYNAGIIDGKYGRNTQAALDRALADSNVSEDIKSKLRTYQNSATFVPTRQRSVVVYQQRSTGAQPQRSTAVQSQKSSPNAPTTFAIEKPDWHNAMTRAGGKVVSVGDGTYAFLLNGNVYYNNGRMKGANGKMSNYDYRAVSTPTWFKGKDSYWNAHTLQQDIMNQYAQDQDIKLNSTVNLYNQFSPKQKEYLDKITPQIKNNYLDRQGVVGENYNAFTDDRLRRKATTYQNGGQINKYQQGGTMNNEQELQKAFMAFLIEDAKTQGITIQSEEDLVKYAESLGEDGIKAKYQEFMQKMQGGVKAKLGTKLNYVRKIKGLCADDEELVYMKQGGRVCPVCQKKMEKAQEGTKVKGNAVEEFKKSRKQHVNPDDTVHVKPGVPRSLFNSDGTAIDKRFPVYSKKEYQKDLKTEDGRKRVLKQDIRASKCGGKVKK